MRPKKIRWVKCNPKERCFKPLCRPLSKLEDVHITLDEFEAVRLHSLEGLKQEQAAKKLKISRPTFSRIISKHKKLPMDWLISRRLGLRWMLGDRKES